MKKLGSTLVGPSQLHKPINIHCVAPYTPHMLYGGSETDIYPTSRYYTSI